MGFLGIAMTFLGYLLTYASVANHGRFATNPLTAIFADAYDDGSAGSASTATPGPAPATAATRRRPPPIASQSV